MSKGMQVLALVVLLMISSSLFTAFEKAEYPQVTGFFALTTVGLLIAIPVVALSRGGSRRR